ncbi:glycoside hydrolase family 78 protein [Flavobacteriaceae bacterium]|nr:glycoside hydrolase family 78 protein [Flavobacteriaceae bacterium]
MRSLYSFLFVLSLFCVQAQKINITQLEVEKLTRPLGLDTQNPDFSWIIKSDEHNLSQTHYQIFVASDKVFSKKSLVWDSGKVNSSESVYVKYQGKPLDYATKYYWTVKVWTNQSSRSRQSGVSFWTTGMMSSENWKSEWIGVDDEDKRVKNSPYFTNDFKVDNQITSAQLFITSRGIYEAHINGKRVGESYLTPGWTSYNNRIQYQAYDVQNLISSGDNRLGVILADGWFRNFRPNSGKRKTDYGDELSFIAELVISFENGTKQTIINDDNWNYHFGSIQNSSIYNGEMVDFNLDDPSWSNSKKKIPNSKKAQSVKPYEGKLDHTRNEMIKKREVLKAQKLIITPSGDKVIDFGQNLVGWAQFKSNLPKGTEITLYHAEVLDKAGEFYTTNLRAAKQKNTFILNGKKDQIYHPTFTFQGFRYLKVEGIDQINLDDFKAVALYSDMEFTGSLTTSNELINQLQENIQWGQRGNFLDVPTDCPQRDERLGWTGDAQAFFNTAGFNMDVKNFFDKWLIDLTYDQRSDGAVPGVVPHNNYLNLNTPTVIKGSFGRTGWADAATIIPWHSYLIYGDTKTLERQYISMVKWIDFMTQNSKNNLYIKEDHWGDWLFFSRDDDNSGRSAVTSKKLIAQAFYCYSTQLLIKSAQALGYKDDVIKYTELYDKLVKAFNNEFVTKNGMLVSDSQTAYVLALQFNLLSEENAKIAVGRLVDNINDYGHLTTGFLGTPFLCHVLSDNGKNEEAIKLLLRQEYPSWLYPVTKGATTIWERWNGIKPDGSFQYPSMNSFNHYAYGAIGEWMYNNLMGLKLNEDFPGYKRFTIEPIFDENFENVKASFDSNYGEIAVEWSRKNGKLHLTIDVPANTSSDVILNKPTEGNWKLDNAKLASKIMEHQEQSEKTILLLGSGKYNFSYNTN